MDRIWQLLVTHHNFLLLYHNNPQKSDYIPLSFQFIASGNKLNPLPINTFKAKPFFISKSLVHIQHISFVQLLFLRLKIRGIRLYHKPALASDR